MTELQNALFKRLNLPQTETVTFEDISEVQRAMALTIPFENLDIIDGCTRQLTRDNLMDKILLQGRGGLCYELNPLMCHFLEDCGFDVHLVAATVCNADGDWMGDGGHITTVMKHAGSFYIIEVGFGSDLPMKPVQIGGAVVTSDSGQFRAVEHFTEKGSHVLQTRQVKDKTDGASNPEWSTRYAFSLAGIDEVKLNQAQAMAVESKHSHFNKTPIVVKRTNTGHVSLKHDTLIKTVAGERTEEPVSQAQQQSLLSSLFGLENR